MNYHNISPVFQILIRIFILIGIVGCYSISGNANNVIEVEAHFIPNATEARPNDIIFFNNTSTNAENYEWQLDGIAQSSDEHFDFIFTTEGIYEVSLIASNPICQDTFMVLITIAQDVFVKNGMPMWPCRSVVDNSIAYFDWRSIPYKETIIPNTNFPGKSKLHAGFDNCGALAFVVFHNGVAGPNNLFIIDRLGNELLSGSTDNGGGFNAIYGTGEIQVVKVPGFSNEWYIIYSEWSDTTGPFDAVYNAARILYSRVQLLPTGILNVIERDQVLTDNNGNSYTYVDGKAVSRTANGNLNAHFLYACRRNQEGSLISMDRFLIDNNGITFQANTGDVFSDWWALTIAQSTVELSPRENIVAVNTRHQDVNASDVFLFDATDFSNSSVTEIRLDELVLVADGGPNDQTNLLPNSDIISNVANDPTLNFSFMNNFDRKFAAMEFSPNGRFLYLTGGGFPGIGAVTYITYLAQIDLQADPLEVRLQIQTTPNNVYSEDGAGCGSSECSAPWTYVSGIESGYDGNLYFLKQGSELFVIPDPNNFMPQNLNPTNVNIASTDETNIPSNIIGWGTPDQIDGFNYLNLGFKEVELIVTKVDCSDTCMDPYTIDVQSQGELITSFKVESCPDTFYLCADTTLIYNLIDPISEISFANVVNLGEVMYPQNTSVFDFSNNESVMLENVAEELFLCEGEVAMIFGEEVSVAGVYFSPSTNSQGCDTLDAIRLEFYEAPTIDLELTNIPCDSNGVGTIHSNVNGVGPFEYSWDYNNIVTSNLSNVPPDVYTLEVIDGNGCTTFSTIDLLAPLSDPELDFEIQNLLCYGDENGVLEIIDSNQNFEYSLDGNNFQNFPVFNNLNAGQYTLHYSNEECDYVQSFEITSPTESLVVLPDDVTINLGESYEIESQTTIEADPLVYNWDPIETLSCDDCSNPLATPKNTTLYTLSMPDTNGCVVLDDILITVKKDRNLFIPNVFSPNGDGQNEIVTIFADESVEEILIFRIFDRWGEFIFQEANFQPNDPAHGWDGTFNGKILNPAVFTYYAEVKFVDGEVSLFKGDITIVR